MGPHPLPGYALDGKPGPVHVEKNPSILFLFLPRGPGTVVRGRGGGLLLGTAAEEAVRAGALGPAVPAQLGRGGAGPAWRVGSRHWSQEGQEEEEEEEEKLGQAILLRLQELLLVCQAWPAHVDLKGQTWQDENKWVKNLLEHILLPQSRSVMQERCRYAFWNRSTAQCSFCKGSALQNASIKVKWCFKQDLPTE